MYTVHIKRAAPSDVIVWSGATFNLWASLIEQALGLDVAPPLMIDYGLTGPVIKLATQPERVLRAKLTSAAAGTELYNAKSVTGPATGVDPSAALTLPDAGEAVSATEDVLVERRDGDSSVETGSGKHRLKLNTFVEGPVVGYSNEATPRPVIRVAGGVGATASPTSLSVTTLAADATSWSRATDGTPLTMTVQTRTYWDSSGGVLYQYLRTFTYDARGLLLSVSAETRSTIDTPGACS
jgi:hypothetical protein